MSQNSKLILKQLHSFPIILENLVVKIPQQNLQRKINNKWSVLEQVKHLIKAQNIHLARINQFISETKPHIRGYNASLEDTEIFDQLSTAELLSNFKETRKDLLLLIKNNYTALTHKQGSHDEYELYDFELLLNHILNVDYAHLFQIEVAGFGKHNL